MVRKYSAKLSLLSKEMNMEMERVLQVVLLVAMSYVVLACMEVLPAPRRISDLTDAVVYSALVRKVTFLILQLIGICMMFTGIVAVWQGNLFWSAIFVIGFLDYLIFKDLGERVEIETKPIISVST